MAHDQCLSNTGLPLPCSWLDTELRESWRLLLEHPAALQCARRQQHHPLLSMLEAGVGLDQQERWRPDAALLRLLGHLLDSCHQQLRR